MMAHVWKAEKPELAAGMRIRHGDVLRVTADGSTVHFLVDEVHPEGLWEGNAPVLSGHLMPQKGARMENLAGKALVPMGCRVGAVWDEVPPPEVVDTEAFYVPLGLPACHAKRVGSVRGERVFRLIGEKALALIFGGEAIPSEEATHRALVRTSQHLPFARRLWELARQCSSRPPAPIAGNHNGRMPKGGAM